MKLPLAQKEHTPHNTPLDFYETGSSGKQLCRGNS